MELDAEGEDLPGATESYSFDDDIDRTDHPSSQVPLSSSPAALLPDLPASPVWNNELDNVPGDFEHLSSPLHAHTPPETPPDVRMLGDDVAEADDPGGLEHDDMEVAGDYPFDDLLGDRNDGYREHLFFDAIDAGHDIELGEADPNNALYNENFGLPDGEDAPEMEPPRFQLPVDGELEELDHAPDGDPDDGGDDPGALCEAFREHELIRNAYIDAFIQKVVYGATHRALKHMLRAARRTISANPNVDPEDIANMAQTIGTAENRLGVNTNNIITTFTRCPTCKRRYSPKYIATTNTNTCLNEGCEGELFTVRNLASGSRRRVSNTTYPFASPIAWLQHVLRLPGMSELMQNWQNDENGDRGLSAPISSEEWMRNLDIHRPVGDISEGWGWRSTLAGLERREDPNTGGATNESALDPPIRFVSLPFGLSLSLNTDW